MRYGGKKGISGRLKNTQYNGWQAYDKDITTSKYLAPNLAFFYQYHLASPLL